MNYRSGLERTIAKQIAATRHPVDYEAITIDFIRPQRTSRYTPDFVLPNGIILETKGRFLPEDRLKHLLVKEQHPELDIRFVFSNSRTKLRKGSTTTYADWCRKHGFLFADKLIPRAWLVE